MARKVSVELTDDLDGTAHNVSTVEFGLDGTRYEIDLSDSNAADMRDVMQKWVAAARRVPARPVRGRRPRTTAIGEDLAAIRAWAKTQDISVSERGRVAASIIDAYHNSQKVTVVKKAAKKAVEKPVDAPEFSEK